MSVFAQDTERLVAELDAATEAHLGWTRRVLRCAVLHSSPGDDVLAVDAHRRCHFGRWFSEHQEVFAQLDSAITARVLVQHQRMHDAVRRVCQEVLDGRPGNPGDLDAFETSQATLVADLAHFKTEILAHAARYDSLTRLPLRYGLAEEFVRSRAIARRNGHLLVLLLVDVDHFKQVNDVHGHTVGDQALCHVASVLRAGTRSEEPVFRFGGEEFLIILYAANTEIAEQAAERLLQALRDAPLLLADDKVLADGKVLDLRISAGLAVVGEDESMAHAVDNADRALYMAKQTGRDRWCWAPF